MQHTGESRSRSRASPQGVSDAQSTTLLGRDWLKQIINFEKSCSMTRNNSSCSCHRRKYIQLAFNHYHIDTLLVFLQSVLPGISVLGAMKALECTILIWYKSMIFVFDTIGYGATLLCSVFVILLEFVLNISRSIMLPIFSL